MDITHLPLEVLNQILLYCEPETLFTLERCCVYFSALLSTSTANGRILWKAKAVEGDLPPHPLLTSKRLFYMLTYPGCEVCQHAEYPPTWFPVYEFGVKCCIHCFYANTVSMDGLSDEQKTYSRWPPTHAANLFWRSYLPKSKEQRLATEECERLRADMISFAGAMQKRAWRLEEKTSKAIIEYNARWQDTRKSLRKSYHFLGQYEAADSVSTEDFKGFMAQEALAEGPRDSSRRANRDCMPYQVEDEQSNRQ
ncbi:hypothetical protein BCR43DRAFT_494081 [Syncephalastrum racemosum]|uniref:F-box domain-containing protein n=1 Tax=Syncephalastrum racemosum TaxID=13706 RepID=A0A1X2H7D1_SYNRA|nr:hypothetical protein BCR43DRAFT_494081 [Syncephalastrum racemosum]